MGLYGNTVSMQGPHTHRVRCLRCLCMPPGMPNDRGYCCDTLMPAVFCAMEKKKDTQG